MKVEDEARKRDASTEGTSAMREDNSPRTDNQSGPTA